MLKLLIKWSLANVNFAPRCGGTLWRSPATRGTKNRICQGPLIRYVILFGIGMTLGGCWASASSVTPTPMSPEDSAFATAVPIGEMNTKMKLRVAKELEPELKIDSSVALILENLSKEEIGFQGRYGLRIFVYSTPGEEWIEVKDRYPPYIKNPPPLDPQGGDFSEMVINVRPVLTNEGKPITVRILVVGTIYRNGAPTAEEVGAYTEVVLNP